MLDACDIVYENKVLQRCGHRRPLRCRGSHPPGAHSSAAREKSPRAGPARARELGGDAGNVLSCLTSLPAF